MKQFTYYLLFLLCGALILSSCNKNSGVNPNNKNKLSITPYALVSSDGNILYIGTSFPSATFAAVGNYYLDLTNDRIYGPKTASGWGTGLSLKGPQGPKGATGITGAPGNKIYAGSGVPASTLGTIGDYYLDKANILLYGPKTAAGWGTPTNLRSTVQGPQGPQGNPGPTGGSSNVKTDEFTLAGSDWLWNSQYVFETSSGSYTEYFTRYYVRKNNSVTTNVLNNGLVLAFFTPSPINNPNQWAPLPYQFDSSFGYTYNYVFVTAPGQVTLHYYFIQTDPKATLPTLSTYNDETRRFKIITVLGETGTFMMANHINLNDYDQVSRATGLWQQDILEQQ
jgi:hypothetical protein